MTYTTNDTGTVELTDAGYALADRLELVLEATGPDGATPSAAARKTGVATWEARHVLDWMAAHQHVHTSGNGTRTRYRAGRGNR